MNNEIRKQLRTEVDSIEKVHDNLREVIDNAEYADNGDLMPPDYFDEIKGKANDLQITVDVALENIREFAEQEQEKFDNMSESLQGGPTGEAIQEAADNLNLAVEGLEAAVDSLGKLPGTVDLDEVEGRLNDIADCLYEAIDSINAAIG